MVKIPKNPGLVNGPVLNAAQWAMGVNTVHPSMHRLLNATWLTGGLYLGRETMNILTGETPSGEKIDRDDLPAPLRPLHGIIAYNHYADDPGSRWMKVVDNWIPALMGATGAVAGSHVFALDQPLVQHAKAALRDTSKLTVDRAEQAAIVLQARPWRVLSGFTSLFGSASGFQLVPGPTNYGSSLGASFLGTVPRNKLHTPYLPWLQKFVSGNNHPYAYGPASMATRLRDYMLHNHDRDPKQLRQMAYAILEPWFADEMTQAHLDAFVHEVKSTRDKFLKAGGVPERLKAECEKELSSLLTGMGLEKTFRKIGLNPAHATIGRNGFIEYFSRLLGAGSKLDALEKNFKHSYLMRHGLTNGAPVVHHGPDTTFIVGSIIAAGTALGVTTATVLSRDWHRADNDALLRKPKLQDAEENPAVPAAPSSDQSVKTNGKQPWYNGRPLDVLEWATDALNSPETLGLHRVYCAGGLSLGGFAGMKLMDILTGRTLSGAHVSKDKVPAFLEGLYKKLAYNPHSDRPKDRWGMVLHFLVPALFATGGVVAASETFFKTRRKQVDKAEYIDDFENKATMVQAGPWTGMTALTSLFATPAGFSFLPFPFNYGTALGTRFTLSSGRKVIFPGLGELWTNTASRYPYGPPGLRDMMVRYAINNPSRHPEQLEEMAIGILKPWFENVKGEQIETFIHKVEEIRDKYLREGGVPEEFKKQCEAEMLAHFKGAGLEKTLQEIGLDPLKAHLGNNGFSGKVAQYLGASDELADINKEFAAKYATRLQEEAASHADRVQDERRASTPNTTLSA